MSLTHIFFDLDGTLVDSSEGIHNGFVQTFERLGLPVPSDIEFSNIVSLVYYNMIVGK